MRLGTTIIAAGLLAGASVLTAPPANAMMTMNGLYMNGLPLNGVSANGLFYNGMFMNGLRVNGVSPGDAIATIANELNGWGALIVREVALPDD